MSDTPKLEITPFVDRANGIVIAGRAGVSCPCFIEQPSSFWGVHTVRLANVATVTATAAIPVNVGNSSLTVNANMFPCGIAFGAVSVASGTQTQIVPASATRRGNPTIASEDGSQIFLGSSTVTIGGSFSISTNPRAWWPEGPGISTAAIFGIAASGVSGSHSVSWSSCE